jgi:hypothetical protein
MLFTDALSFDHPRKTQDGYMVVRARAARAGIYDYLGAEVDPKGEHGFAADQTVKVYRPESEVFAADSVASFLMKPVTNDHPAEPVTAANWRDNAKGVVGRALRDGEYLAFDIVLMDKGIIDSVESGKRELSNGYASIVDFTPGETETGDAYDAVQRQIRGNHVAVVDRGRAGPMCRISDAAACDKLPGADLIALLTDERTYSDDFRDDKTGTIDGRPRPTKDGDAKMPHTLIIDGLQVTEVSDPAKAAIEKLQAQASSLQDKLTASETKVGELTATVSTKDGEIKALEQKLEDAKVSPQQLEQMARDRALLIATAKAVDPSVVTDGKSDAEIREAVVRAKLGDAANGMDEAGIGGAFKVLTKDVKPAETKDGLREAIGSQPVSVDDARAEYDKAVAESRKNLSTGWQKPAANAA